MTTMAQSLSEPLSFVDARRTPLSQLSEKPISPSFISVPSSEVLIHKYLYVATLNIARPYDSMCYIALTTANEAAVLPPKLVE